MNYSPRKKQNKFAAPPLTTFRGSRSRMHMYITTYFVWIVYVLYCLRPFASKDRSMIPDSSEYAGAGINEHGGRHLIIELPHPAVSAGTTRRAGMPFTMDSDFAVSRCLR